MVFFRIVLLSNKGNADVSIVGNDLVIKANGNTDDIAKILLQKVPKNFVGTPLAFSNGSQDVALLPMDDPISTRVSVTVKKYGSLKIAKQDEDGKYVPNTSFKLSYNADMSNPIGTYKTGADGTVTVPNQSVITENSICARGRCSRSFGIGQHHSQRNDRSK